MSRGLRQVAIAVVEQLSAPLSLLVCTLALSKLFAPEDFGLFTYVLTVPAVSFLLSLGISSLIAREVSLDYQSGDPKQAAVKLQAALGLTSAIGVAGVLCCALLWAGQNSHSRRLMVFCIMMGAAAALIQELDALCANYLKGEERFTTAITTELFGRLLWVGAIISAARLASLPTVLLTAVGMALFKLILKLFACRNAILHRITIKTFGATLAPLIRGSCWLCAQAAGGALLFTFDRFSAGHFFGPAEMGRYVACSQLASLCLTLPAAAGTVIVNWYIRVTRAEHAERTNVTRKLRAFAVACMLPGLALAGLSHFILRAWLGESVASNSSGVLAVLSITTGLIAAAVPFHFALVAEGETRKLALINIAAGSAGLAAAIILSPLGLTWFSSGRFLFAAVLCLLPLTLGGILRGRIQNAALR